MSTDPGHCDCTCLGCSHFCAAGGSPLETGDAHHTRILLAIDRSIAAACRSRGVAACDGLDDGQPCEVGTLHSRAGEFAAAMATVFDGPVGAGYFSRDHLDRAHDALESLLLELTSATDGKSKGVPAGVGILEWATGREAR